MSGYLNPKIDRDVWVEWGCKSFFVLMSDGLANKKYRWAKTILLIVNNYVIHISQAMNSLVMKDVRKIMNIVSPFPGFEF